MRGHGEKEQDDEQMYTLSAELSNILSIKAAINFTWAGIELTLHDYIHEHNLMQSGMIKCNSELKQLTGREQSSMADLLQLINDRHATIAAKKPPRRSKARMAKKLKEARRIKKAVGAQVDKPKRTTGIMEPLLMSDELRAVCHSEEPQQTLARPTIIKQLWQYIKANKLQDPNDGRQILCDAKLQAIMGRKSISSFQMAKAIGKHVWKPSEVTSVVPQADGESDADDAASDVED